MFQYVSTKLFNLGMRMHWGPIIFTVPLAVTTIPKDSVPKDFSKIKIRD